MDLAALNTTAACDAGAELELKHPVTGKGLGQFIKVQGRYSTVMQEHTEKTADEARAKAFEAEKRGEEVKPEPYAVQQANGIELLAKLTIGFRCDAVSELKGGAFLRYPTQTDVFEFSEANVKKLYREQTWIKEQVDRGVMELRNFMKG